MTVHDRAFSRMGAQLTGSAIRQMGILAAGRSDLISFAPGYPDPDTFAWDAYRDIADDLLRAREADTLQYGPTRGYAPLLEALVPRLRQQGVTCTTDDLLLTTGSQQALDLVTRLFVDPGDVVLVELPTFTGAIAAFRSAGARLVGVRQDADGLDLAHLTALQSDKGFWFVLVQPVVAADTNKPYSNEEFEAAVNGLRVFARRRGDFVRCSVANLSRTPVSCY